MDGRTEAIGDQASMPGWFRPIGRGGAQRIPRPDGARPGDPAPWAHLPPDRRRGIRLETVVEAVLHRQRLLSAEPPLLLDAARGHGDVEAPEPSSVPAIGPALVAAEQPGGVTVADAELDGGDVDTLAAVLVALFEEGGESRVVLTRRAEHLRVHRGEVSFPGGRAEPAETPEEACRREAAEEVGLDSHAVSTIGRLGSLRTVSSRSQMVPVVGILAERPSLQPSPDEVARVFDVALADLAADGIFHQERWPIAGAGPGGHPVSFFDLEGETIWGATAAVLVELLTVVLGTGGVERR